MSAKYLKQTYLFDDPALVLALEEMSLWSAPFGLKLLECVEMKQDLTVLDIGPGTGFPLIELAQRLGSSSKLYGIDPWETALNRAKEKIAFHGLSNIDIISAQAENIPFSDGFFDLVVSNNGLNNVDDLDKSLNECFRVTTPGSQLVITMNLPDTFIEFYIIFRKTLEEMKFNQYLLNIDHHIFQKRKPLEYWINALENHGFFIRNSILDSFSYRFSTGSALLNYSFFKICFLEGWKQCIEEKDYENIFNQLEGNLNEYANQHQGISLSVPFVCFNAVRR